LDLLKEEVAFLENHRTVGKEERRLHIPFSNTSTTAGSQDSMSNSNVGEALWLHLHTYFSGKQMDKQHILNSLLLHDKQLMRVRAEKANVLREIRQLRLDDFHLSSPISSASTNPIELTYSPSYSVHLQHCVNRVGLLLSQLEAYSLLYPNMKALRNDNVNEWDPALESRIDTLHMWDNTLRDLVGKINEAGDYLGLIEGSFTSKITASRSSKTLFSTPASPTSSSHYLTPYTPTTSLVETNGSSMGGWKSHELWPDNFFSARAIAERLSRSSSSSSPHTGAGACTDPDDRSPTINEADEHMSTHHNNSLTAHMCSDVFTQVYHKVVGRRESHVIYTPYLTHR